MINLPDALDIDGVTYDVEITLVGGVVFFKVADDEKRGGLFNLAVELNRITELVNCAAREIERDETIYKNLCVCTNSMEGVVCGVHPHSRGVHEDMLSISHMG